MVGNPPDRLMKILHLFDPKRGSRYPLMISWGLMQSSGVQASFSAPVTSLGQQIALPVSDLNKAADEADYIFRASIEHFQYGDGLDWHKVIYYDFSDSPGIDDRYYSMARLYVKRSSQRRLGKKFIQVPYGILPEYYTESHRARDYDVSYPITPNANSSFEQSRYRVSLALQNAGFTNIRLGQSTDNGRRAILEEPTGNPFLKYLSLLSATKVLITCSPDHLGGDSRLWEAFASGALVVMDKPRVALPNPFIDGRHCLIYEPNQIGIDTMIARVKVLLGDNEARQQIAKAGYKHAQKHHRAVNRVGMILGEL